MHTHLSWLKVCSLTCREASELQSQSLEQPLPWRAQLGLRIHLLLCKWCRRYGEQIRFLREACRQGDLSSETPAAYRLSDEARQNLKEKLRTKIQ